MMSKRRYIGAAVVGLATVALAGGLIASNMGFKLNKTLATQGQGVSGVGIPGGATSLSGINSLALPFNRQVGMTNASHLKTDIGASCTAVSKLLRSNNLAISYTGTRGDVDFALEEGVGYQVRVTAGAPSNLSYIVVGSDDPSYAVSLLVQGSIIPEGGTSLSGLNRYAYKYHATAATASALKAEIGSQCTAVSKFLAHNNLALSYTGTRGDLDFPLVPGEAYGVRVTGASNVPYTASHY
jgi:hypothetical protein